MGGYRTRIRLTEREGMEGGVRCPECGRYACFGDVVATGRCVGCAVRLELDLVVYSE